MSTSPSVIRRFVEYYAGLDAQPPAALAALYHPDATLSDPFGQHQGCSPFSATLPICWPTWSSAGSPSTRRFATASGSP